MQASSSKWPTWAAVIVGALALGIGIWYAQHRGWLAQTLAWVEHPSSGHEKSQGGMGMPGMDMSGMGGDQPAESSGVPGLAAVQIAPELQQRLGVTTGEVRKEHLRLPHRLGEPSAPRRHGGKAGMGGMKMGGKKKKAMDHSKMKH